MNGLVSVYYFKICGVGMRKLFALLLFAFVFCFSNLSSYAENGLKLFYDGKIHELKQPVLTYNREYFLDAQEFASATGMKVSTSNSTSAIEFKGKKDSFAISSRIENNSSPEQAYTLPEMIGGKLYFPFSFLKSTYNMVIKYNAEKGTAYIFSRDTGSQNPSDFKNITYDYEVKSSKSFKVLAGESENGFDDNTVAFQFNGQSMTATIACDRLDEASLKNMRQYLNDFTSDDDTVFKKFVDYKKSYFNAMQDYYKRNFLYGIDDENSSETNMKVFGEYPERLFGQDASSILYNIIKSDRYSSAEDATLSLTIPVSGNLTVYTLTFTLPKGGLTEAAIASVNEFVNSLSVSGLPSNSSALKALSDKQAVEASNDGVYPVPGQVFVKGYNKAVNEEVGYEISYPSLYTEYRQNNLIGTLNYKSFKINYNNYFSVSSEPAAGDGATALKDKIALIKNLYRDKIKYLEEGTETLGGRSFQYLKYTIADSRGTRFLQDYFITGNSSLINVQLNSAFIKPSQSIENEFVRTVASLRFTEPAPIDPTLRLPLSKFTNQAEGYSLYYPGSWQKVENTSTDINYDSYSIKNPDYSGPLEVVLNEGELTSNLQYADILKYVSGAEAPELKKYFKKYSAPYLNKISRLLFSSVSVKDGATYLYKLVNYLDSSNRGKLCYSVDIIRDKKVYSLFITTSDYMTKSGKVTDKILNADLNLIGSLFGLEATPDSAARAAKGETRNSKLVFIEDYLRQNIDKNARIASIETLDSVSHVLVNVKGSSGDVFYRIKADYANGQLQILDKISKQDVLALASQNLKKLFEGKIVEEIKADASTMTLDISYRDSEQLPVIKRSYHISGKLAENAVDWKLQRMDYSLAIKNDCRIFLDNFISADAHVYFNPAEDFTAYEKSKEKLVPYYTSVFAEFGELSGFFVLKINPVNDGISLESYTPIENIHDRINKLYSLPSTDYTIYNVGQNASNKFEFQVFMTSKYSISYRQSKLKLVLDENTHTLVIEQ